MKCVKENQQSLPYCEEALSPQFKIFQFFFSLLSKKNLYCWIGNWKFFLLKIVGIAFTEMTKKLNANKFGWKILLHVIWLQKIAFNRLNLPIYQMCSSYLSMFISIYSQKLYLSTFVLDKFVCYTGK